MMEWIPEKTEEGRAIKKCPLCQGTGKVTYITPKGYTKTVKHLLEAYEKAFRASLEAREACLKAFGEILLGGGE